jgi:3-hydroxyisobutyrate dehydrogenase
MSQHLLDDGHDVIVFDVIEEAMTPLVEAGAQPADDPAELAERSDVVFLSLPRPEDVEGLVLEDLRAGLSDGDVVVDMSTSLPSVTRELADELADDGVSMLGAPVSRGASGAEAGTLAVLVGGDGAVVETARPYFEAFATDVVHVGDEPEHGHVVKLLNNYLSFSAMLATCEAAALGESVGLELDRMMEAFNQSSGHNSATERKFPDYIVPGTYDAGFPMELARKDLRLFTRFGDQEDQPLLLGEVVAQLIGYAHAEFGDDADQTRLYDFFKARIRTTGEQ